MIFFCVRICDGLGLRWAKERFIMGHRGISEPNTVSCRCKKTTDEVFLVEPKAITLTGKAADEFVDMVLSPAPEISSALRLAVEFYEKTVVSE